MSVTKRDGTKIQLPRIGADQFWKLVQEHYAHEDDRKWKYLAILALRENAGWNLDRIGKVFNHPKGHITRCLAQIKRELRANFEAAPEYLNLQDEDQLTPIEQLPPKQPTNKTTGFQNPSQNPKSRS